MDYTVIGTGIATVTLVYAFLRDFKADIEKRIDIQDERIFLLATGKSLREAMIEAKKNEEARK